jgi:hypothetical protein
MTFKIMKIEIRIQIVVVKAAFYKKTIPSSFVDLTLLIVFEKCEISKHVFFQFKTTQPITASSNLQSSSCF